MVRSTNMEPILPKKGIKTQTPKLISCRGRKLFLRKSHEDIIGAFVGQAFSAFQDESFIDLIFGHGPWTVSAHGDIRADGKERCSIFSFDLPSGMYKCEVEPGFMRIHK